MILTSGVDNTFKLLTRQEKQKLKEYLSEREEKEWGKDTNKVIPWTPPSSQANKAAVTYKWSAHPNKWSEVTTMQFNAEPSNSYPTERIEYWYVTYKDEMNRL